MWENSISYPDILLLPKLAKLLGVTVDELLSGKEDEETAFLDEEIRKNIDEMFFRIYVNTTEGDLIKMKLPMKLIRLGLAFGNKLPQISGNEALQGIDFAELLELVENGVVGKLLEIETKKGDIVEIVVN